MHTFEYSAVGIALTKEFEGLRLEAYQDCAGVWTIGYGHTGPDVHAGRCVTEPEAGGLLLSDLGNAIVCVNRAVGLRIELAQHEFDALVDFCFNVGRRNFQESRLLGYVNAGDSASAADQFGVWVHVEGKAVPGLVRRRAAEAGLFRRDSSHPEGHTGASRSQTV